MQSAGLARAVVLIIVMAFVAGAAARACPGPRLKYGYMDKNGVVVIKPSFHKAATFSQGLAVAAVPMVRCNDPDEGLRYGFIDKKGQWVVKPQYNSANDFSEGLAAVDKDGRRGFIDERGKYVIAPRYSAAPVKRQATQVPEFCGGWMEQFAVDSKFSCGLAPVLIDGFWGGCGYINTRGETVIAPRFKLAKPFSEGLAAVLVGDRWGFIDKSGRLVIEPRFYDVGDFKEGLAPVQPEGYEEVSCGADWGYIDKSGRMVIQPMYSHARSFSEGSAVVTTTGQQYVLINHQGLRLKSPRLEDCEPWSEGMCVWRRARHYRLVDKTGHELKTDIEYMWGPKDGLVLVGVEDCPR